MAFFLKQKVTAYVEKVTAHVGIAHRRLERTFSKSNGAIIDILSNISENKNKRYQITDGRVA